jgi:type IV pilus assembly protein PilQ
MFCTKLLIASPSLVRSAVVGTLLLSAGVLAATHETRSRIVTKPNKSNVIVAETTHPTSLVAGPPVKSANSANAARRPHARTIRSVKVSKDHSRGGQVLATIELDGQAQYTYFTLPSPYRLVVDVQSVISEVPSVIQIGMADLKRVRLGKMDDAVRVVFDSLKPQPFQIEDDGTNIRIWFGSPKPAPTLAADPKSANHAPPGAQPLNKTLAAGTTSAPPVTANVTTLSPKTPTVTTNAKLAKALVPVPPATKATVAPAPVSTTPIRVTPASAKPVPVNLPAIAKKPLVSTVQARLALLAFARKSAPAAKPLLARNYDMLPPPKTASRKASVTAKTTVVTQPPRPATTDAARTAAASNSITSGKTPVSEKKGTTRVVTATPTPISAPPTTPVTTPIPVKAPANEKTVVATPKPVVVSNSPIPDKPAVTAPVAPATTAAPPTPRPREVTQTPANPQTKIFNPADYVRPDFVGEPINLDLRSTQGKVIDIRDFLRFITDTYKVNFVIDQSVREIPITVTLQNVPWNQAMDALLRANRLGVKVEGSILRVMSQETVALEDRLKQEQIKARQDATPLVTEMVRLRYAKASTTGAGGGGGASLPASSSPAAASGSVSGAGSTASGSGLDGIITSRLSARGKIQADPRTNTLIITDVPENVEAIKDIIAKLDVPEPQVEIESRIVIANRNFARDLGVQLGATALNTGTGGRGTFSTLPDPTNTPVPVGSQPNNSLSAAGASSVLSLTTGLLGTARISALLTAAESKGNVKTISSPRITALNNQTANIVNGIQIPVQTESNNTLTVTFVTAALRLEITPQINDAGNVLLRVVAENNSVNTAIATSAAPGINTQRAETTVLVPDGGTTIIGGINIDVESNSQQRTPGVSRIPGLGELFKRRQVSRQTDEILFFITPRVYRPLDAPKMATSGFPK